VLWGMAIDSCDNGEEVLKMGHTFAMLEAIDEYPQRQQLNLCDRLLARLTISQGAGDLDHLGNPAAIVLPFDFHRQVHGLTLLAWTCSRRHSRRSGKAPLRPSPRS
jgi:hypothetical protein